MKRVEKVIGKPKLTTLISFSSGYGKITMYIGVEPYSRSRLFRHSDVMGVIMLCAK